jgi:hypothetical protein
VRPEQSLAHTLSSQSGANGLAGVLGVDAIDLGRLAYSDCHSLQRRTDRLSSYLQGYYSHSMVPGGLLVTSRTTRLTSRTSLVMRVEMRDSTS